MFHFRGHWTPRKMAFPAGVIPDISIKKKNYPVSILAQYLAKYLVFTIMIKKSI